LIALKQPGRRTIVLLALGALALLVLTSLLWAAWVRSHRASTYGITDPSRAALRVANGTSDFAITRITVEDARQHVVSQEVTIEVGPGASTVLELAPGPRVISVRFVEIDQAVANRPEGSLSQSVTVSPGEAVLLSLQGGRSSPDGMIFVLPRLVTK
jgi:hypothetical protein